MESTKWWLDSQTIQGALLTYLPPLVMILSLFGVKIGDAEVQTIIQGIVGIVGLTATTYTIIKRIAATKTLTLEKPQM